MVMPPSSLDIFTPVFRDDAFLSLMTRFDYLMLPRYCAFFFLTRFHAFCRYAMPPVSPRYAYRLMTIFADAFDADAAADMPYFHAITLRYAVCRYFRRYAVRCSVLMIF